MVNDGRTKGGRKMKMYKIMEGVSGEVVVTKAKDVKTAVKRLIDFLPVNEELNDTFNYDISVERISGYKKRFISDDFFILEEVKGGS